MEPTAWRRVVAFLFDYLLVLAYLGVLAAIGTAVTLGPWGDGWSRLLSSPVRMDLLAFVTTVFPVATYFAWSERSLRRASWGKHRMGLRVVTLDGGRISTGQAAIRAAAKFTPWQMAHTALLHIPGFPVAPQTPPVWTIWTLGGMWILVAVYLLGLTRVGGRRTLYDRLSGTRVIVEGR